MRKRKRQVNEKKKQKEEEKRVRSHRVKQKGELSQSITLSTYHGLVVSSDAILGVSSDEIVIPRHFGPQIGTRDAEFLELGQESRHVVEFRQDRSQCVGADLGFQVGGPEEKSRIS